MRSVCCARVWLFSVRAPPPASPPPPPPLRYPLGAERFRHALFLLLSDCCPLCAWAGSLRPGICGRAGVSLAARKPRPHPPLFEPSQCTSVVSRPAERHKQRAQSSAAHHGAVHSAALRGGAVPACVEPGHEQRVRGSQRLAKGE